METIISFKIDNLIRNYCSNFLSYLYSNSGWKRTIFETSKENYIPSIIEGKNIRIIISNNGKILLTCYCFFDIIKSVGYIIKQFEYGRMGNYIIEDEDTIYDKTITTIIKIKNCFNEKK